MILWINGAFGAGKTTAAYELKRRLNGAFIYDPEQIGYFLFKNLPKDIKPNDFQNIPLWREFNYKLLSHLSKNYGGVTIAPMTLYNPEYYDEIIGRLERDGVEVRHFILYAKREEIIRRLKHRSFGGLFFKREAFACGMIDKCLHAFDTCIKNEKIFTDNKNVKAIVEEIALKSGLKLNKDNRGKVKRAIDGLSVYIKHIR